MCARNISAVKALAGSLHDLLLCAAAKSNPRTFSLEALEAIGTLICLAARRAASLSLG